MGVDRQTKNGVTTETETKVITRKFKMVKQTSTQIFTAGGTIKKGTQFKDKKAFHDKLTPVEQKSVGHLLEDVEVEIVE